MADSKQNNGVKDKAEHFDLSTEQVELSPDGCVSATIRISTNMKWTIK